MKFQCNVRVMNRNPKTKTSPHYMKSTIAIGKETYTEVDYFMLHFSSPSRGCLTGSRYTKYRLNCNPTQVFTKCLKQGKITLSFEDPPHDLFIQADAAQLDSFVEVLKRCLAGEPGALNPTNVSAEARERYNQYLMNQPSTS